MQIGSPTLYDCWQTPKKTISTRSMFSNWNDTVLGCYRVIMQSANEKRGKTSQNDLIYRVETRGKLEARVLRRCECLTTRFSSLRGHMISKLYHNPLTIGSFVVRTLRQTIRAKPYLGAFVSKARKIASSQDSKCADSSSCRTGLRLDGNDT